jgi:hypothetical protein
MAPPRSWVLARLNRRVPYIGLGQVAMEGAWWRNDYVRMDLRVEILRAGKRRRRLRMTTLMVEVATIRRKSRKF